MRNLIAGIVATSFVLAHGASQAQTREDMRQAGERPVEFARVCADSNYANRVGADARLSGIYGPRQRDCLYYLRQLDLESETVGEEVGQIVLPLVQSSDISVRLQAILTLGMIGHAPALDPLLAGLTSPDWRVALVSARALGGLNDPAALEPLMRAAAEHWSSDVRTELADAIVSLGGMPPLSAEEEAYLETLDEAGQEMFRESVEQFRAYVLYLYGRGEPDDEARFGPKDNIWMGDASTFSENIPMAFDESGNVLRRCTDLIYEFDNQRIDFNATASDGISGPAREAMIELSGGHLLVRITDWNPQYVLGMPGEVVWHPIEGEQAQLLDRSIQFHTREGEASLLLANPGSGPSPGAVYAIRRGPDNAPELVSIAELPGPPRGLRRMSGDRFAVITQGRTVIVFNRSGILAEARCAGEEWQ